MTNPERISTSLERALASHGVALGDLCDDAMGVAMFGSRAVGCARPSSDWDLLCIGEGVSRRVGSIDLVWVHPRTLEKLNWLGTDLAGHVETFSVWVKGACPWNRRDLRFDLAAARKATRIENTVRSLGRAWGLLGNGNREKYVRRVWCDVRRLCLLRRAHTVPPTALLDSSCGEDPTGPEILDDMFEFTKAPRSMIATFTRSASVAREGANGATPSNLARAPRGFARSTQRSHNECSARDQRS